MLLYKNRGKSCRMRGVVLRQALVMDNAPFHKSKKTRELIESVGCKLLYQPAYSPDLNPIENQWNTLKEIYKAFKKRGYLHDDALNAAFRFI